jgi:Flavin containing amine oxidoreductase
MGQGAAVTAQPNTPSAPRAELQAEFGEAQLSAWGRTRRSAMAAAALAPLSFAGCQPAHRITGGFTGTSPERGHLLRAGPSGAGQPSSTRSVHTLIAGGGVAGLSAARALRLQGLDDFALLELEDSAGGNARAGTMAGMAHPLGAHYLPVPSDGAPEVQDFLEELDLRKRIAGRWQYDERHLCHSPQERLFFNGAWQDGLLPTAGVGPSTLAQYAQFAKLVAQWRATGGFQIPVPNTPMAQANAAQLAMPFVAYLDAQGLQDSHLRWYLDYCCRDDYGAGLDEVSAWAGIHYFAARHGFSAPGALGATLGSLDAQAAQAAERDLQTGGVLTWPQGNAFLTQALAKPLGERLRTGRVVLRITEGKSGVAVDALNVHTQAVERWQAQRCIVALPVFIAQRVVSTQLGFLQQAALHTRYASWLVANVQINAALKDTGGDDGASGGAGAAPAWDNVIYNPSVAPSDNSGNAGNAGNSDNASTGGLGYVDAMHQSTRTAPGPSVLTYYRALGTSPLARRTLLAKPWAQHRDETLADLRQAHPDIDQRAVQVNITRYGHAMAVPTPQFVSQIGLWPKEMLHKQLLKTELSGLRYAPRAAPHTARLRFAHSDWSGYSVLEEAFTRGLHAAL